MSENRNTSFFRQNSLNRISSPEQLRDYLRVTNPGIWIFLAAVIVLLAGIFAWSTVGTLETTVPAKVICMNDVARVAPVRAEQLEPGMVLRIAGKEALIQTAEADEYGRPYGVAEIDLLDGTYDGVVVTQAVHPIEFLLAGR